MQTTGPRPSVNNTFDMLEELQAHLTGEKNGVGSSIEAVNNERQSISRRDPVPKAEVAKSGGGSGTGQKESILKLPSRNDQGALTLEERPGNANMASHVNDLPKTPFRPPPPSSDVEPPSSNGHPTPGLPANTPMAIQVLSSLLALGKSENYNPVNNKQGRQAEARTETNNDRPARERPIVKKSQRDVALAAASTAVNFAPRPREAPSDSAKGKSCNCKRSQCLKLYCECFAAGGYCLPSCSCLNCSNTEADAAVVDYHRQSILTRNPFAFDDKINGETHKKGCRCKRSKCLKKYCECYNGGVRCNPEICQCEGCRNLGGEGDQVPATSTAQAASHLVHGRENSAAGEGKEAVQATQGALPSTYPRDGGPAVDRPPPLGLSALSSNRSLPMENGVPKLLTLDQSQVNKGLAPGDSSTINTLRGTPLGMCPPNPVAANAALLSLLSQRNQGMDMTNMTMGLMQMMLAMNRVSQMVPQQPSQNALADILPLKLPKLNAPTNTAYQTPPVVSNKVGNSTVDGTFRAVAAHVSYNDSGVKQMPNTAQGKVLASVGNTKEIVPQFGQWNSAQGVDASMSQKKTMTGILAAASKKGAGMSRYNPLNHRFDDNENIHNCTMVQDECDEQGSIMELGVGAEKRRPKRAASGGVQGAVAAFRSDWGLGITSPPHKRNLISSQEGGALRRSDVIKSLPRGL